MPPIDPTSLPAAADVPDELRTRAQWVCWREERREGKPTKVPIDPATGTYASTADPDTWDSFEAARAHAAATNDVDGLGFVFTAEDPLAGVDLDDCRDPDTGEVADWATDIVDRLDSYTEVSPSGTGYHVLLRAALPEGRNRSGDVELYDRGRYFTVTGAHVEGTPATIEERSAALRAIHEEYVDPTDDGEPEPDDEQDGRARDADSSAASSGRTVDLPDDELLERARAAANGEKFQRLWRGDTAGYESHSEADMALCALLAFWTGGDEDRVDRLFRQSGLMREKWDEVHYSDGRTYGETTVARAVQGTSEVYEPDAEQSAPTETNPEPVREGTERESAVAAADQSGRDRDELLERIERLEATVEELHAENERLREELRAERERRAELEGERDGQASGAGSLWERLTGRGE